MAKRQTFWLYGLDGEVNAVASPAFVAYVDKDGVTRDNVPSINNRGGGLYSYNPSDDDESDGTCALIDGGADCKPRYYQSEISLASNPFAMFFPVDINGDLSAGAPTVQSFKALSDGSARTPPDVVQAGALEIYTVTPTTADLAAGARLMLAGPTGLYPHTAYEDFLRTEPVLSLHSPTEGEIAATDLIVIDAVDPVGLRSIQVSITGSSLGLDEIAYTTATGFGRKFSNNSNKIEAIEDGLRLTLLRDGGWLAGDFDIETHAINIDGSET